MHEGEGGEKLGILPMLVRLVAAFKLSPRK